MTTKTLSLLITLSVFANAAEALDPVSWRFGSGFDGDGGFHLRAVWDETAPDKTGPTPATWTVDGDGLRFTLPPLAPDGPSNNYTDAGAFIAVEGLGDGSRRDFQVEVEGEIISLGHDWNRFGIVALGGGELGGVYNTDDYHSARLQRPDAPEPSRQLRIAHGMGNHLGGSALQFHLPHALRSGKFVFTLTGRYGEAGDLFLTLTVWHEDYPDEEWTTRTDFRSPGTQRDGVYFGFGGRFRSGSGSATEVLLSEMRIQEPPPVSSPDEIAAAGVWHFGGGEHPFSLTAPGKLAFAGPAETVVYLRNLPFPRLGTDEDEAILEDLLADGLAVIELDCANLPRESMALQRALLRFFQEMTALILHATDGACQPDIHMTYWLPAGYRLERAVPFWNIERHGAHGSLERIVHTYNTQIVPNFGENPIEHPEDLTGPGGQPLDYDLYLDIMYPSGSPAVSVPAIAHFATLSRRPSSFRAGDRPMEPLGWLFDGYALVYVDHIYNPLARHDNYGHFEPGYSLQSWNGIAAGSAAIRFLRAHAGRYNLSDRIGALGHSKSSYSVARLADPRHPDQEEHSRFSGFPDGSPQPQPWPGYSSEVNVAFASMGDGTRRTQYFTEYLAPTVIAVGRFDHFNHWDAFPPLVSVCENRDVNHLALWMEDLGHDRPFGEDLATGIERNLLVRSFFAQHLHADAGDGLEVLFMLPRANRDHVPLDGVTRILVADEELPADMLDLSPHRPVTVRFARSIDTGSTVERLHVLRAANGEPVPGNWTASLQESRFQFTPSEPLLPDTVYAVHASAGIRDREGRALSRSRTQHFRTTGNGHSPGAFFWRFGSEYDGDGGFQTAATWNHEDEGKEGPSPGAWSVEPEALRFFLSPLDPGGPSNNYTDAGALFSMAGTGMLPGQDFQIQLTGDIISIGHDWNRFGIVALADDKLGVDGFYNASDYYAARIHRPVTGARSLRIGSTVNNTSGEAFALPHPISSGGFVLTLTGTHDDDNRLLMVLEMEHADHPGEIWSTSTGHLPNPKDGAHFGLGGRFRSSEGSATEILFQSFSIQPFCQGEFPDHVFVQADLAEDSNGDGIPDWWMREFFGFPGAVHGDDPAPDGSGWNVRGHFLAGTDPFDPHSVLRLGVEGLEEDGGLWLRLSWTGMPGRLYFLEQADRSAAFPGEWISGDPLSATPPRNEHWLRWDPGEWPGSAFFRLRAALDPEVFP